MATHPDFSQDIDDHAAPEYQGSFRVSPALFIGSLPCPGAHVSTDPRTIQRGWDEEGRDGRRRRRLQRAAVRRATGLTPDQFRRFGTVGHRLIVAAGLMLLFWMALGIIVAAFGGRL